MAPTWFQAQDYFENKLSQMQASNADYTAQKLMDAFNEAGYTIEGLDGEQITASANQLFRHFTDYGNAENVSPNNYFDVNFYKAAKVNALNEAGTQTPPDGAAEWTTANLDAFMASLGLSYWDHYTLYGTLEGLNPSAQFNTNRYLDLKLAQLNSETNPQPLPDGSDGPWTREALCEALRDAGLNAIEHYELYNVMDGVGYVPGSERPATTYKLIAGDEVATDNGVSTDFVGIVDVANGTLNPGDQITGTNNDDALSVTLNTLWSGFQGKGSLRGVPVVNIHEGSNQYDYSGVGSENVSTYNVHGNADLVNLQEGVKNVNLFDVDSAAVDVRFAASAVKGKADSLTLGVANVAREVIDENGETRQERVHVYTNGIEDLVVNSQQAIAARDAESEAKTENRVVVHDADLATLGITGAADLKLHNSDAKLTSIDASTATGDLYIQANQASRLSKAILGQGDDTLVAAMLQRNASVDGGEGVDAIVLGNGSNGTYNLNTNDIETLGLHGTNAVTINAAKMSGLSNVELEGQHKTVTLTGFNNNPLNLNAKGYNEADVRAHDVSEINVKVGDDSDRTPDSYLGTITSNSATSVEITLESPINDENGNLPVFAGGINAKNAQNLSINALTEGSSFSFASRGNLENVSQISAYGDGSVDLRGMANIGSKAESLSVQASGVTGGFWANFQGGSRTESLVVAGATDSANNITIGSGYDFVQIIGGSEKDTLYLPKLTAEQLQNYHIDLGEGANTIFADASTKALLASSGMINDNVTVVAPGDPIPVDNIAGSNMTLPSNPSGYTLPAGDYSQVTYAPDQEVTYNVGTGDEVSIGQLTSDTLVDATGSQGSTITYTGNNDGTLNIMNNATPATTPSPADASGEISVVNSGGGQMIIQGDETGSAGGYNRALSSLTTFNLDSGENGGSISVPAQTTPGSGGTVASNMLLTNVTSMDIAGDGAISIQAAVGSAVSGHVTETLAINGGNFNGGLNMPDGGMFIGKTINFTTGSGNDNASFGVLGTGSTIDPGAGDDTLTFNTGGNRADKTIASATIDLSAGGADKICVLADGSGNANNNGTVLRVQGYESDDGIFGQNTGNGATALLGSGGSSSGWTEAAFKQALVNYGIFTDSSSVNVAVGAGANNNTAYYEDGGEWNACLFLGKAATNVSVANPTLTGTALVIIENVGIQTPASFADSLYFTPEA